MQVSVTDFYEEEWYSICCYAPPLHELCIDSNTDMQLGMCMCCKEGSVFELENPKEDNNES